MSNDLEVEEFLSHFGIKGMRWGVIKERRRASAQVNRQKASEASQRLAILNEKRLPRYRQKANLRQKIREQTAIAEAKEKGKLTPRQKSIAKGAAVAGVVLAAYGTYKLADKGEFNRIAAKGKNFVAHRPTNSFKQTDKFTGKMSSDDIMRKVVPGINQGYGSPGTRNNCRRATMAYEMRRRGYDVKATKTIRATGQTRGGLERSISKSKVPTTGKGLLYRFGRESAQQGSGVHGPFETVNLVSSGIGRNKIDIDSGASPSSAIFSALRKQPNGSRGELGVAWLGGGAHSMAYEIINGKPVIFDAQSGRRYTGAALDKVSTGIGNAAFTRLDDKDLNFDFLQRWVA